MPKIQVELTLDEAMYVSELSEKKSFSFDEALNEIIRDHISANCNGDKTSLKCPECGTPLAMDTTGGHKVVFLCPNSECSYIHEIRNYDS